MRALFGIDPDRARAGGLDAAREFETALAYHAQDFWMQLLRGPGSPYERLRRSRARLDVLILGEIDERRRSVRDEVMTLLFAGHDTTTSAVSFLFLELAQHPELADDPRVSVEMLIDETLRKYPPAYIGPRRSVEDCEIAGVHIPGGAHVHYCSWASHHLPDVFADPQRFDPLRFTDAARAALPKSAYVPFGGGSRTCIGMRFGQAEIALITRRILSSRRLDLVPGYRLRIRHAPTISPRGGLPMTVRAAPPAAVLRSVAHDAAA